AESFFSRLRRMIGGQHLKVEGRYLDAYVAHAGWLEDHREESNGRLADCLIGGALASPVSRAWKGYWHRRHPRHTCLSFSRSF
ncbi:transposase, partial [Rhodobacteraceae bacterium R_SAG6]|nr:transposase [Rhodobacteraceae bacterium R_SAG6]